MNPLSINCGAKTVYLSLKLLLSFTLLFCHTEDFGFDVGKFVHLLLHVFWILYLGYEGLHVKLYKYYFPSIFKNAFFKKCIGLLVTAW